MEQMNRVEVTVRINNPTHGTALRYAQNMIWGELNHRVKQLTMWGENCDLFKHSIHSVKIVAPVSGSTAADVISSGIDVFDSLFTALPANCSISYTPETELP